MPRRKIFDQASKGTSSKDFLIETSLKEKVGNLEQPIPQSEAPFRRNPPPDPNRNISLSIPEFRKLLDKDWVSRRPTEVIEQYQLAWCIARCTGVGPRSLDLTWREVQIKMDMASVGCLSARLSCDVS